MTKSLLIARQSSHPTGLFGRVVANVMARDTAAVNDWVLGALEPKPGDSILELGCGHGRSLSRLAAATAPHGSVVGIDPSEVMRRTARRRNRREIAAGRVAVESGDSDCVPYPADRFDKWVSVHSVYFWPDLRAGLCEAARVLRPGGELFLGFHPSDNTDVAAKLPRSVYSLPSLAAVETTLADAGFTEVTTTTHPKTRVALTRARLSA
jgi:ubiquinone/menaquinone biosynthesis C-methylase UbiE